MSLRQRDASFEDSGRVDAPLPAGATVEALVRCAGRTAALLARGRLRQPRERVGLRLRFADGTSARVYRETVLDGGAATEPCVLVVAFRLRVVRGRWHAVFRAESLLNTPLFVGVPGFVSKLWLAHDDRGVYRGFYEWDGSDQATYYARYIWRVLSPVSVSDSIRYRVVPGLTRDEALAAPEVLAAADDGPAWWRPVEVG